MTTAKKYVTSQDIRGGFFLALDRLIGWVIAPTSGRTITTNSNLTIGDVGNTIRVNSATAVVLTIPNDTTVAWSGDTILSAYQQGVGTVSFAAGSGVTLRTPSGLPTAVQYSIASAMRVSANEWVLL